jgi:hypothetical protein
MSTASHLKFLQVMKPSGSSRTGDHVATLQSLWEDAPDQSQRPSEPGARRQMRHIAEQLSRQRFIWIPEFSQSFLTAARTMYGDTAGQKNASERAIPTCIDGRGTSHRDHAGLLRSTERCLREWRQHLPKKRNRQWRLEIRLKHHKIMSQAIDQLRVYGRVPATLSNTAQSPIPSRADTPATMKVNPAILPPIA